MLGAVGILVLGDICPRLYRWGTCCDSWYRSILLYLFLIGGGLGCLLWANGGGGMKHHFVVLGLHWRVELLVAG